MARDWPTGSSIDMRPNAISAALCIWAKALLVSALVLCGAPFAFAGDNLLLNPNFEEGSGDVPSYWSAHRLGRQGVGFAWVHKPGLPGQLQVTNSDFDFAQWSQSLSLQPGWYRLAGEIETKRAGRADAIALLGVSLNHFASGWALGGQVASERKAGEVYFKVARDAPQIQIICRLTGPGTASFQHLQLSKIAGPPPPEAIEVDLGAIQARDRARERQFTSRPFDKPTGSGWTEVALMAALAAISAWGWRTLGPPHPGAKS